MKIDSLSSNRSTAPRRSNGARSGKPGAFVKALSAEPPATPAVAGSSGPGPLEALLALQEVPDPLARRRQAAKRGAELLDQLEEIRLGLLTGALPRATMERLAEIAGATREKSDDPQLEQILAEIELRAAVELAKLGA